MSKKPRSRKARLLIYVVTAGFTLMLLGIVAIIGAYLYFAPTLPDAQALREIQMQVPLRVYTRDGRLIAEYGEQRRVPLTLEQIPDELEKAVLAAEDERFYTHYGIDPIGIARAMLQNMRAGRIVGGASTITQQVAKNFFLTFEQIWSRKIREIFLAFKIERELTKDEILTLYLNKIYLGNRAYGVGAAAEIYYGKPVDQLTLAQMAMIATLPKAPSKYNPLADPQRALERRGYVLDRMLELGYIGAQAHEEAMAAPITAAYHGSVTEVDAHYVGEMVRADLVNRVGADAAYSAGYRVITSLDSRLQAAANVAVRDALQEYDSRYGYRGPLRQVSAAALEEAMSSTDGVRSLLRDIPTAGAMLPAVVIEVTETGARALLDERGEVQLTMEDLVWAAPMMPGRNTGPAPKQPSDVLAAGDIVYVYPQGEGDWRLGQVPDVQGALVSLDPEDGAVVAMVGGYDYFLSKYNRAVQARRQPGSSFKPFVYSAALANGFTPATIVNDAPVVFADDQLEDVWRPENDSGRFYGPTRLREALVRSRNLVSIRVMQTIGIATAIRYINQTFGFERDRLPRDLSLALGSGAYSPLEMATAYAVLANGGFRVEPYFIDEIIAPDGSSLYRADPAVACRECELQEQHEAELAVDEPDLVNNLADAASLVDELVAQVPAEEDVAALPLDDEAYTGAIERREPRRAERVQAAQVNYLITDMMRDVIRRGTGARAMEIGRHDLAGKTGTTNEYRDAWFSGFNPEIVTTMWVGFDDFSTLGSGEYGGRAALPGWISFMRTALQGTPEVLPERPPGLVTVRIDPQTGLLSGAGQPGAIFETFIEDTLPAAANGNNRDDDDNSEDDTLESDLF